MRKIDPNLWVNMEAVIGDMVHEYGVPYLKFTDLVTLGEHTVRVYKLGNKVSFDTMCVYIKKFIDTPFGAQLLRNLSNCNNNVNY